MFYNSNFSSNGKNPNWNFSFLFLVLTKYFNIQIPEESAAILQIAFGLLWVCFILLGLMFNIFLAIVSLYYKDKQNLELKFKNYPILIRIIKYYEKTRYISIIIWAIMIYFTILILFFISLFAVLKILNKI